MAGRKVTGPMATYAEAYAKDKGLAIPHQANKPIDTQIKSVEDAQERPQYDGSGRSQSQRSKRC